MWVFFFPSSLEFGVQVSGPTLWQGTNCWPCRVEGQEDDGWGLCEKWFKACGNTLRKGLWEAGSYAAIFPGACTVPDSAVPLHFMFSS